MNILLICTGKTSEKYIAEGVRIYVERISRYCRFSLTETESGRGEEMQIREKESGNILKKISENDFLVLLDEKGKEFTSVELAQWISHHQNISTKKITFVIGGAYGCNDKVHHRANMKLSLSKFTFPYQLVRLIFLEQLYRVFTILRGEKYHH